MSSDDRRFSLSSPSSIATLLAILAVVAILLWATFNLDLPAPNELRDMIVGYGWAGWLVFVGITAAIAVTPIPITLPALVAGSLYGVIGGTVVSLVGVMLGSWLGYWLARAVGERIVFQVLGRRGEMVQDYLENAGFWATCTMRLMPGVPYWPVNYGAGALGVSQSAFVSATFVASIPGQVSLVALGTFAADPSVMNGVVLVVAWAVVLVLTWISYRHWRATRSSDERADEAQASDGT